jgi:hypothetical protein
MRPGSRAEAFRSLNQRRENHFDFCVPLLRLRLTLVGVVAQLVERLNGIQEVRGSNPLGSTILVLDTDGSSSNPRRAMAANGLAGHLRPN